MIERDKRRKALATKYAALRAELREAVKNIKLSHEERKAAVLMRNEQMGQVVGEAERRELEALQQQIASNIRVKAYSIAQTDMTDLLRKVSQTWQRPVADAQGGPEGRSPAGGAPPRVAVQ